MDKTSPYDFDRDRTTNKPTIGKILSIAEFYDDDETISAGDYCYDPYVTEPDEWPALPDDPIEWPEWPAPPNSPEPVSESPKPKETDDDKFIIKTITPFEMPKLARLKDKPRADPVTPQFKRDTEVEKEQKQNMSLIIAIIATITIGVVLFVSIIAQSVPAIDTSTLDEFVPVLVEVSFVVAILGTIMKLTGKL